MQGWAARMLVLAALTRTSSGVLSSGSRFARGLASGARRGRGGGGRGRGPAQYRPPARYASADDDDVEDEGPRVDRLYGVSPVLSALRSERREFRRLWIQDTLDTDNRADRPQIREIETLAAVTGMPISRRDKGSLNGMCRNRPHQGLVLEASPLDFEPLNALPDPPKEGGAATAPVWLALDEVTDPQNLGALLRSAHFLGVDGVLVSAKNSCSLTPTVSKASAGAMELAPVYAARNLPRTLEAAKDAGWQVVGAALEKSVAPSELAQEAPTVLVLGSEGHGLRTNVLRACSSLVRIPRGAAPGGDDDVELVDSLNVSVAGGILLWTLLNARGRAA